MAEEYVALDSVFFMQPGVAFVEPISHKGVRHL